MQRSAINVLIHHEGKILNDYGDGSLCKFPSVRQAMHAPSVCKKILVQQPSVPLRIGLHVGEILYQGKQALGDGVNLASRIQSLGVRPTVFYSHGKCLTRSVTSPNSKLCPWAILNSRMLLNQWRYLALANEGLAIPKKEGMTGKLKESKKKNTRKPGNSTWVVDRFGRTCLFPVFQIKATGIVKPVDRRFAI